MPEEAAPSLEPPSEPPRVRKSSVKIIRDYDPEHGTLTRQGSVICFSDSFKRDVPRSANVTPQPPGSTAMPRPASAPIADRQRQPRSDEQRGAPPTGQNGMPPMGHRERSPYSRDPSGRPPAAPPRARPPRGDDDLNERVAAFRSRTANMTPPPTKENGFDNTPDSRSRSPERYRSSSPNRFTPARSRSPEGYRSSSPNRFTPARSRSPEGYRSSSPNRFTPSRSRSPEGYRSSSPVRFLPSERSPTPVRSLGGGFGSRYNAASPTNFPDYIAGVTEPPTRPVLHSFENASCPLKAPKAQDTGKLSPSPIKQQPPASSAFRCPVCIGDHSNSELSLSPGEKICLKRIRAALDAEDFNRAEFVIQSVSSQNMAEWERLFALLSASHQRHLYDRNLQPKGGAGETGAKQKKLADMEVDSIIYHHCLDDLKKEINRVNFKEDLASNREISFLQDQVHGLRVQQGVWPDRVTQLEEENVTLKEKLSENRQTVQQLRRELTSTQDRLQEALCEQHLNNNSSASLAGSSDGRMSTQDHRLMQRVLEDYEDLQREMDRLRAVLSETEGRLFEAMTDAAEKTKKMASLEIDVQRLESENHALRRRSIYESSRAASTSAASSCYNGMLDRGSASTASFRTRSAGRASLWTREPSIDRQTVADLPRVDDSPVDDRRCSRRDLHRLLSADFSDQGTVVASNADMMTMSLPPAAFQKLMSGAPSVDSSPAPPPSSPPIRPAPPGRSGPSSALNYHDVKMIERQYDQLQNEKRRLESALSHLPQRALNPRMRRECREERERLEASLDATERQIGAIRMTLRQFNVLKSTA